MTSRSPFDRAGLLPLVRSAGSFAARYAGTRLRARWKRFTTSPPAFDRIAFLHLFRCGGTYTDLYLGRQLRAREFATRTGEGRDWSAAELESFLELPAPAYVHNHLNNWPEPVVARYRAAGWLTFTFYRHPGDHWCSAWHFHQRKPSLPPLLPLDIFVRRGLQGRIQQRNSEMRLPSFWRELDYVAVFSDQAFGALLKRVLFHDHVPEARLNQSDNPGYDALRARGEISDQTHRVLLESKEYETYLQLLEEPHVSERLEPMELQLAPDLVELRKERDDALRLSDSRGSRPAARRAALTSLARANQRASLHLRPDNFALAGLLTARQLEWLRLDAYDDCELHCVYCPVPRSRQRIPLDELAELLERKVTACQNVQVGCEMEPTADPLLLDLLGVIAGSKARPRGIFALHTNGLSLERLDWSRIRELGLNRAVVSIDTLDPQLFAELRGGSSLEKLQANLLELRGRRPEVELVLATTVTRRNLDHIAALLEWGRGLGAAGSWLREVDRGGDLCLRPGEFRELAHRLREALVDGGPAVSFFSCSDLARAGEAPPAEKREPFPGALAEGSRSEEPRLPEIREPVRAPFQKLAFLHLFRTAGTFVDAYLSNHLSPLGYSIHNSGQLGLDRDFAPRELEEILLANEPSAYVHNHSHNWPHEIVQSYQAAGYLTLTFVRHPGDQWCSSYHYHQKLYGQRPRGWGLDEFLIRCLAGEVPHRLEAINPPRFFRELDYAGVFSEDSFARFLELALGHAYQPRPPLNSTDNRGYQQHRQNGEISDQADRELRRSEAWAVYEELLERPVVSERLVSGSAVRTPRGP